MQRVPVDPELSSSAVMMGSTVCCGVLHREPSFALICFLAEAIHISWL